MYPRPAVGDYCDMEARREVREEKESKSGWGKGEQEDVHVQLRGTTLHVIAIKSI